MGTSTSPKTTYDLGVVLGTKPELRTRQGSSEPEIIFPPHILSSLELSALYRRNERIPAIAACGKWALEWEWNEELRPYGLSEDFRECDEMARILSEKGVPEEVVLREGDSMDTIGNLYFLKDQILIPNRLQNLVFFLADFRKHRLEFVCQKILGPQYQVTFKLVPTPVKEEDNYEDRAMEMIKEFLNGMPEGDHELLRPRLYNQEEPFYQTLASRPSASQIAASARPPLIPSILREIGRSQGGPASRGRWESRSGRRLG